MRKYIFVIAAFFLTACGSSSEEEGSSVQSSARSVVTPQSSWPQESMITQPPLPAVVYEKK